MVVFVVLFWIRFVSRAEPSLAFVRDDKAATGPKVPTAQPIMAALPEADYLLASISTSRRPAMPFFMHYVNTSEPREISEEDAKRVVNADFNEETMCMEMMTRLLKGEKVFVKRGFLIWQH